MMGVPRRFPKEILDLDEVKRSHIWRVLELIFSFLLERQRILLFCQFLFFLSELLLTDVVLLALDMDLVVVNWSLFAPGIFVDLSIPFLSRELSCLLVNHPVMLLYLLLV